MSTKRFAVQIPITGYSVVIIDADSLDEALDIVKADDFDLEDDNNEMQYATVQLIGHQYKKVQAPEEHALKVARLGLGEVNN